MSTMNPWMDKHLPADQRAELLLSELSLDEKMAQVSCYFPTDITDTADFAERFPRGIGEVSALEARSALTLDDVAAFQRRIQLEAMKGSGHGIPAIFHMEGLCGAYLPGATSFPSGLGRAAGWNVDLERAVGEIVGKQERALGITHTLAPVLDVSRDPRMGRHGESYGEDPSLSAALGVAFTLGLQDEDPVGRRTEAVAKHFVGSHHTEGGIHGAYLNVPDRTLLEVYGKPFQAAITLGGLRGIMPSYNSVGGEPASASVRLLTTLLREQMGFDGLVVSDYGAVGNLHTTQRTAQSAPHAGLAALRAGMDVELHVPYGFGPELRDWFAEGRADIALLDRAVHQVLAAKFRMGLFEHPFAPEQTDRNHYFHVPADTRTSVQSARESLVLLRNDGVLPLRPDVQRIAVIGCHAATARFFFGGYTHYSMAEGKLAANSSMAGLTTSGDDLRTVANTVPGTSIEASDSPAYEELLQRQQPGIRSLLDELRHRMPDSEVDWAYGYSFAGDDDSGHDEAVALAAHADVVLLTLGGKHGTASIASMGEGIDATDINLPPCQDDLITKLAQLGKPIIGLHLDGRPVSSDAADTHLAALLEAWSPAEGGAEAIVDVLTGAYGPSGRLPVSVARNAGQVPIYYNHSYGSAWHQGGSVGFADYVDAPHTPRYFFGHGLTYTTFDYADLTVSKHQVEADDTVEVSLTLTNTGNRSGTEVVQLYVGDRFASVSRPVVELAGFRRVTLEPGHTTKVSFQLDISQMAFLDAAMRWRIEAGEVDVMVGASSQDLRLTDTLSIVADALIDGKTRGFYAR
ncbi:glycoside hydrolase family 3 N-terminal domain-containing protein [Arthrobacter burdickii]|uniref:Glycoside hydrolase family 3 N-terminal domain-containing protein n=1 Tax=Arthrobacter burdickii TaxID=3035920 RepID=A0ABT8K0F4_9MICC|nr:glycoside hydrolase family 3 N-terminal domain-containing protein [Arthrobacter burdickii]MDN4609869.1 glycoside hydrolase family 3 N-terminal domain-containing protein [Arthrobacter burdickii]